MPAAKRASKPIPSKLSTFAYECTNNNGAKVKGEIAAINITFAKADLRRQGLNPLKIRRKSKSFFSGKRRKKISPAEISYFSRQMATMMSAGVPLVQSFDIVAKGVDNE